MTIVSDLLASAGTDDLLNTLSPEDYVAVIADTIPTIAAEYDTVILRIGRANIPRFCADLRRGMLERVIEEVIILGVPREEAIARVKPDDLALPRRLETYVAVYPSVEIRLNRDMASVLAGDLARGIALRDTPIITEEPIQ